MGANEFKGLSDLDFQNTHSVKNWINFDIYSFFSLERGKVAKKVWVLAPTTLKSMGAEAPTAPILTWALFLIACYPHEKCHACFVKEISDP